MTTEEKRESNRKWLVANPDYLRKWQAANPEKMREYGRKRRSANREKRLEYNRKWNAANPEKKREYDRMWKVANPEKAREARRKWYAAHPEVALEKSKQWKREHTEENRIINNKASTTRRARKLGAECEKFTWLEIANRDDWTCQSCGTQIWKCMRGRHIPTAPHVDHIIPLSKGGPHTRANAQLLCAGCNQKKSAKMPVEAA